MLAIPKPNFGVERCSTHAWWHVVSSKAIHSVKRLNREWGWWVGGGGTAVGLLVGLSLGFIILLDIHSLSQTPVVWVCWPLLFFRSPLSKYHIIAKPYRYQRNEKSYFLKPPMVQIWHTCSMCGWKRYPPNTIAKENYLICYRGVIGLLLTLIIRQAIVFRETEE